MRICIDAGHGGSFTGATFRGLFEKDIVLAIAHLVALRLVDNHDVFMTRRRDESLSDNLHNDLIMRRDFVRANTCDILVSIHVNADADIDEPNMPEAKGAEVWYKDMSPRSQSLAACIGNSFMVFMPNEPWRGIKPANFTIFKGLEIPAVLVECGFIDASKTNESFRDDRTLEKIADCIASGVKAFVIGEGDLIKEGL